MFDLPRVPFDREALHRQLRSIARDTSLVYEHGGRRFFAPRTVAELTELRASHPQATILAGNTDIGLWVTKQLRDLPEIISIGDIDELKVVRESGGALRIGAGATLTDAYGALARHYPELAEMWERFASPPIRNAGTMGGNVANGSPIGDSMPGLIALGATVILRNRERCRTLPMEDLYVGYMKKAMAADEILEAIEVPLPGPALRFRTYKLSKRFDSDISAVCAAFAIELDGDRIARCRVAYGGRRGDAEARERDGARARRSAVERGDGASGDGRARLRLHSVDRHAGERRLPPADRAESAVPVLSRDAAGPAVIGGSSQRIRGRVGRRGMLE